jgi:hypothetical protein
MKKSVKFNDYYVYWKYKPHVDNEEGLSWTQVALDEIRFKNKLESLLAKKINHIATCKNDNHYDCISCFSFVK